MLSSWCRPPDTPEVKDGGQTARKPGLGGGSEIRSGAHAGSLPAYTQMKTSSQRGTAPGRTGTAPGSWASSVPLS